MGIDYQGDIVGKFLRCQDEEDADNFCNDNLSDVRRDIYVYKECQCDDENPQCSECQIFKTDPKEILMDADDEPEYYTAHLCGYEYAFDLDDLQFIKSVVDDIGDKLGNNVLDELNLTIKKNSNDEFYYNYDKLSGDESNHYLIARYCLGKQIEHCLIEKGSCLFLYYYH